MEKELKRIVDEFDISDHMGSRLWKLNSFEIVIVCDDSGSMNTVPENQNKSRWVDLHEIVKLILRIGIIFDSNGVDIYFLNQEPILDVKDIRAIDEVFKRKPEGYTPLATVLEYIFKLPASRVDNDKNLLVFIVTDGAAIDEDGRENLNEVENLLKTKRNPKTTFVNFLSCTNDPRYKTTMHRWDHEIENLDVTDDYTTECERVRDVRGPNARLSRGDYVVKALIGAIDPEIDSMDD